MSTSFTVSTVTTFTITHARHLAAKVATDLKRMQRFYHSPPDSEIRDYESEVAELLKGGYLERAIYGFRRNGSWIEPTLFYEAQDFSAGLGADDDPGRVPPGKSVFGANFSSYVHFSRRWAAASAEERAAVEKRLPFVRTDAPAPGVAGYLVHDKTYSAGGRALVRSSVRSFS